MEQKPWTKAPVSQYSTIRLEKARLVSSLLWHSKSTTAYYYCLDNYLSFVSIIPLAINVLANSFLSPLVSILTASSLKKRKKEILQRQLAF